MTADTKLAYSDFQNFEQDRKIKILQDTCNDLSSQLEKLNNTIIQLQQELLYFDHKYVLSQLKKSPYELYRVKIQSYTIIITAIESCKEHGLTLDAILPCINTNFLTDNQIEYIQLKYEINLNLR